MKTKKIGVILMTYGSPKTLKDVPTYLKNVYGGKDASPEVIKEFQRRYKLIGGSPLIKITKAQAKALEKELNKKHKNKIFIVVAGMRFSDPFIKDVVTKLSKKVTHIVGIIMSPQYSPIIMRGYNRELTEAVKPYTDMKLTIAEDWHLQPYFIEALAQRVSGAISKLPKKVQST